MNLFVPDRLTFTEEFITRYYMLLIMYRENNWKDADYINEHYHGTERHITISPRSGWYFARSEFGWERYGPYYAASGGILIQEFEQDTSMQAEIGDRYYIDGELVQITKGVGDLIAVDEQAEDVMEEMMRAPGR